MVVSKQYYEEEWKSFIFSSSQNRSLSETLAANRVYASSEVREYDINKADELEAGLEGGHPSFVKPMLQSHVTGGFWLGSLRFCHNHLAGARKGELKWAGSTDRIAYPQMLKFMQK